MKMSRMDISLADVNCRVCKLTVKASRRKARTFLAIKADLGLKRLFRHKNVLLNTVCIDPLTPVPPVTTRDDQPWPLG